MPIAHGTISIHAPTRGATLQPFHFFQLLFISIHAPTRGATIFTVSAVTATLYFNPRSHERSDSYYGITNVYTSIFQSTLPREERQALNRTFDVPFDISIHAPTRGATVILRVRITSALFQSTLPREERRGKAREKSKGYSISIHAPTRGATDSRTAYENLTSISIHAPTRGATAILHKKFVYFYTIPTINI